MKLIGTEGDGNGIRGGEEAQVGRSPCHLGCCVSPTQAPRVLLCALGLTPVPTPFRPAALKRLFLGLGTARQFPKPLRQSELAIFLI